MNTDENIKARTEAITLKAEELWITMNKNEDRTSLWDSIVYGDSVRDNDISNRTGYDRLGSMATAYRTKGSKLEANEDLKKDIINGMEWLNVNKFNANSPTYDEEQGQGYVKVMSGPKALLKCTALMYYDLTLDQLDRYLRTVDRFCPDPTFWIWNPSTGSNRSDQCMNVILRGILGGNSSKIIEGRDALSDVYEYVTTGDGFYDDGSFIQHTGLCYAGGYGVRFLGDTAFISYLLSTTPFKVIDPNGDNVYKWALEGFQPLMYKGYTFDDSRGREISRRFSLNSTIISNEIANFVLLCQIPSKYQNELKAATKYYLNNTPEFFTTQSVKNITMANEILRDESIIPRDDLNMYKHYGCMDFTAVQRPNYAIGLSMHSSRTFNYEIINDENLKGWHQGDGWMQILDDDYKSYDDCYWPTLDAYRYPGTTVVKKSTYDERVRNGSNWVGGTDIMGLYGVTGMEFIPPDQSLRARKSWFFFIDKIICLGTDIYDNSEKGVETIIENKMIGDTGDNPLIINGSPMDTNLGWTTKRQDISSIFVQSNNSATGTGYYLPTGQTLTAQRDTHQGSWYDINTYHAVGIGGDATGIDPHEVFSRNYITLTLDHGIDPKSASYEYTIMPSTTRDKVLEYENSPTAIVLANSPAVQAIKDRELNIISGNFWTDELTTVDIISCKNKASVMIQETDREINISISDPTQLGKKIELELNTCGSTISDCDNEITVIEIEPTIKLEIDVTKAMGKSFKVNLAK